jgi:phospholipase C
MRPLGKFLVSTLLGTAVKARISKFQHVVVIVQENRTPDNLFQGLRTPPYGAKDRCSTVPRERLHNIQTSDWLDNTSATRATRPSTVSLPGGYDLSHAHSAFVQMCDADPKTGISKMDGAAGIVCSGAFPPKPQSRYVENSGGILNPHLTLARQYGWANYMFQTNQGPSFPAHQFLFGELPRRARQTMRQAYSLRRIRPEQAVSQGARRRLELLSS